MKKRVVGIFFALVLCLAMLPMAAFAEDAVGAAQSSRTVITTVDELMQFAADVNAGAYDGKTDAVVSLEADLDLSGKTWTSIGCADSNANVPHYFSGKFYGNGHTISNLDFSSTYGNILYESLGFFGYIENAVISDLTVQGSVNVTETKELTALGLIVGESDNSTIRNCVSDISFTSSEIYLAGYIGLCGYASNSTIEYCQSKGDISITRSDNDPSSLYVGGIVVYAGGASEIRYCANTVNIEATAIHVGGIAGSLGSGNPSVTNCYSTGKLIVRGLPFGGNIGGIVGSGFVATFSNCCFNGTLSINVDIKDVASGIYKVGGLAGDGGYESKYENCYVSGVITDSSPSLGGVPAWLASDAPSCEFTACYYPAGTLDPFVWNKPSEEKGYTAVPLASMASKATFPKYDFSSVWTMGQSYPIQKVFTHLSNGSSTPVAKPAEDTAVIDASEYIQQHVSFAQSNSYSQQMDQRMAKLLADAQNTTAANAGEAAYDILNTASELSKFKSLSIFDNPYDAMLTELILSATSSEVDSLNTRIEAENLKLANSIWDMILKVQPNYSAKESTYKPAIQELLSDPEHLKQRSPDIYEKLAAAIEQYRDDKGTRSALDFISGTTNFFGKAGEALDVLEDYQNTLDWIIGCANYVSVVHAYEALNEEYIQTLHQVAGKMGNSAYATSFRSALQKYDDWLNCEVIAEALEFTTGFAKLTYDTLSPLTENVMTYYLSGCLGLDVTNVTVVIAAYNLGWSLSNSLTGNDKMVESREIIRASYYVEDALYSILQTDREELKNKKDLSSAQKFDASYMLLRTSEMYALQAYKDYLDASEKSFTQGLLHLGNNNFNTTETTLANFAILRWDAAPELPNMELFAKVMAENGVLASLAHSAATAPQALQAFDWGFSHVTHFYNACTTFHKKNGLVYSGIVEATYLRDDVTIELIGDGRHIPRESMLLALRIKGADSIALITDAMRAAGVNCEKSVLGARTTGVPVVIRDDVAQLPDLSSYAGSIATMDRCLRTAHVQYGIPLPEVSRMLSLTPARLCGVSDRKGSLEKGKDGDVVVLSGDFQVQQVYARGDRCVFET